MSIKGYGFAPTENYPEFPEFDVPTPEERSLANSFFEPYLFFENQKDGRILYSSCCHRKELRPKLQRTMTENDISLQYGAHNEQVSCPWCGTQCTFKNVKMLGKKKKIKETVPVLFMKEKDGLLYAMAFWLKKDYQGELEAEPKYHLTSVFLFSPGWAGQVENDWGERFDINACEGNYNPNQRIIKEPFTEGSGMFIKYCGYRVIGLDAIGRSSFRYCQYERFHALALYGWWHFNLMKFLAASCIYPRNIEMLLKAGLDELVDDLVRGRRKNADLIKWGVEDPCKAFGLEKRELKAFLALPNKDIALLRVYKLMKKIRQPANFADAEEIQKSLNDPLEFLKICGRYEIKPMKALRYLRKVVECSDKKHFSVVNGAYRFWRDYLTAAEAIGYDLKVERVLLPHDLSEAHDNATEEHGRRLEAMREKDMKEAREKQQEILRARNKKYNFEFGDYCIFVAPSAEDVIYEGRELKHCVGGYAARHMEGIRTICFLRHTNLRETPYVTIEMDGNQLIQIHGYRNDQDGPDPKMIHKNLISQWSDWLKKGSPRNEDGSPKLGKKKKEVQVA